MGKEKKHRLKIEGISMKCLEGRWRAERASISSPSSKAYRKVNESLSLNIKL